MRRRDFIKTTAGAGTFWSFAAYAQQSAVPVIGVLHGVAAVQWADRMVGFHKGLGSVLSRAATRPSNTVGQKVSLTGCQQWRVTLLTARWRSS
jgi:hypothetical protein